MESVWEELINSYADEAGLLRCNYEMMCRMLDVNRMRERIQLLQTSEAYVYGGGYLGIQFYRTAGSLIHIPAIVDKKGALCLELPDIPVVDTVEFRRIYAGQKVIVASVRFYKEIRRELSEFVEPDCIVYLGELLGGIMR